MPWIFAALAACVPDAEPLPDETAGDTGDSPAPCPDEALGDLPPVALDCDAFEAPLVLTDDPERPIDHTVDCVADVSDLTLEPGVVVAFAEDAGLRITGEGTLEARGDACSPVVLQGTAPAPGHWRGLFVDNDGGGDVRLSHAIVRHAGGQEFNSNGDRAAIVLWSDSRLTVEDSIIADSGNDGIRARYSDSELTLARNRFEGHTRYPILALAEYASALDVETTFTGNPADGMVIFGGLPAVAQTWARNRFYVFEDEVIEVRHGLTIAPGAEVRFQRDAGLAVYGDAPLIVEGTVEDPVRFRGEAGTRGEWRGILVDTASGVPNILAHAEIVHAGSRAFNSNGDLGAIIGWADVDLALSDIVVGESGSYGLNAPYRGSRLSIEGHNVFTENASAPVNILAEYGGSLPGSSLYAGNDEDFVRVELPSGLTELPQSWAALDVPWRLSGTTLDISSGRSLTIEAGAIVEAEADAGIRASDGSLVIAGTAAAPVTLRAVEGQSWRGLFVEDPPDAAAIHSVRHAVIEDAGSGPFNSNGDVGGIVVWADTDLTVSDTTFRGLVAPCAINGPSGSATIVVTDSTTDQGALVCE